MRRLLLLAIGAIGFGCLVVLNVGGYRYGVSDQAFYIPVILQELTPNMYPHDASLIAAQDRFFFFDDWFAGILRYSNISIPSGFLIGYALTLLLIFGAIVAVGRSIYTSWWTVSALAIGLTIRHRIPDTAVNTLESYFHPRLLAFSIGLWAVAAFLRGRTWLALVVTGIALLAHPTTGLWFVVFVGSAALVSDRNARPSLIALIFMAVVGATYALAGPLREQLVVMDPTWSNVLSTKDYLIASEWLPITWFGHCAVVGLIGYVYWYRRSLGLNSTKEDGLIIGCVVLLGLFLLSVPFASARIALVVQLQFNRIFWLLDLFGSIYLAWLLVESPLWSRSKLAWLRKAPRPAMAALLLVLALSRGGYVMFVERTGHPVLEANLAPSDWHEVMEWAATQPLGTHFLAEPDHAVRYGTSIRASGGQDVFLEIIKDTGIAIYSADIAHRLSQRIADLGDFKSLNATTALRLADQYDLDFLITEHSIDLPETKQTGRFHVYDLNSDVQLVSSDIRTSATFQDN